MTSLTEQIKAAAHEAGFDAVGIARIAPPAVDTLQARLRAWLAQGYHGLMEWMGRDSDRRADPSRVLPGCRSVIALGVNYYTGHHADESPGHGRIARYAWGADYHDVLRARLETLAARIASLAPAHRTRAYVDTGPIMEKAWAERAGLGWIGKHSNLVSPRYGSWLVLAELLTTLELEPDTPGADLCGTCTLCLRACPTGAIVEPYVVDATRCISYLTIELRGGGHTIDDDLAAAMGNRIFGCDDCLDVCPYNTAATPADDPAFQPTEWTLAPRLFDFERMSEPDFTAAFRQSPIRRPKLGGLKRSVGIAIRNDSRAAARR
jgi:epoxyqueuosine reductase